MNRVQRTELQRSLTRLADGDRTAFRSVFESVWPLVRRFAERLLPVLGKELRRSL